MEAIMEVIYPRGAGLDVHKQTVVACVRIAGNGTPLQEVRTFATTTAELLALADWLERFGVEQVAMEATGVYWKPVWHILESHFQLVLANAAHVKNVPGRKTDVNDAMWLADLLAHGLIRASFVPPVAVQELRGLTLQALGDGEGPEAVGGVEVDDDIPTRPAVTAAGVGPLFGGERGQGGGEPAALKDGRLEDLGGRTVEGDERIGAVARVQLHDITFPQCCPTIRGRSVGRADQRGE
jgi:hypothetical protein